MKFLITIFMFISLPSFSATLQERVEAITHLRMAMVEEGVNVSNMEIFKQELVSHGNELLVSKLEASSNIINIREVKRTRRQGKIARGKVKRKQCEDSLSYITGFNEDSDATEVEIDAMLIEFAPIHSCLSICHLKKCRRLIKAAEAHPVMGGVAIELSEIVKL